jgi:hypothetical protein
VSVFGNLPRENDLDHEISTYLIHQLKSTRRRVPAKIHITIHKNLYLTNREPNDENEKLSNWFFGLLLPHSNAYGSTRSVYGN